MSHTKGPWRLRRDPCHFHSATTIEAGVVGARRPLIPEMVVQVGGDADILTLEANARLVSVAPDLLNALQMLIYDPDGREWIDSDMSDNEWDAQKEKGVNLGKAAILKALGRDEARRS